MTIETAEVLRVLNRMADYADVALYGAMKEGYMKATTEAMNFILSYEHKLGEEIANEQEKEYQR